MIIKMSNQSEYATIKSMNLKADIYHANVLAQIRAGNLTFNSATQEPSPLQNLYIRSYEYSKFPDNITPSEQKLLDQLNQSIK